MLINTLTKKTVAASLLLAFNFSLSASEFEYSGKIGMEERYFFNASQYSQQLEHSQTSFLVEPEFTWSWNDDRDNFIFKPFYRYDAQDDERTHGDIRELAYIHVGDDWEVRAGIRKVYWGVAEFQHLVDVINQTDGVDSFDGENKLGQQMLSLSLVRDWGIVDLYLLPGFRERTFAGIDGRLRAPVVVDKNNVSYESSAEENHTDLAARWSHTVGDYDIGAYWFRGTNRDPILTAYSAGTTTQLRQYYNQMDQLGIDVQATIDDWLWKFESIYRDTQEVDFAAIQAGFEYTYIGVFDSAADVGVLMEYSWDSRGKKDSSNITSTFQNDIFWGSRLTLNDVQSSELLVGMGSDLNHNAMTFIVEASRRIGENIKASLDIRMFNSTNQDDPLFSLKDDDYAGLSLEFYF